MNVKSRVATVMGRTPALPAVLAAWAILLLTSWPGQMAIDSHAQLRQARTGVYDDSYPPLMSVLWGALDRVVAGPAGLLVLQTGLLVWGLYGIARVSLPPGRAACVTAAVALFPPVLAPMRVVWSDALMAGLLMIGAAALLHARGRHATVLAAAGLLALALATGIRPNGFIAVAPLLAAIAVLRGPRGWARWRRATLGLIAALLLTATSVGINYTLAERHVNMWHESNAVLDLVGTLRYGPTRTDAELRARLVGVPVVDGDLAVLLARQGRWNYWWMTHGDFRMIDPPVDATQRAAIERALYRAVRDDPVAYLMHRAVVFGAVVGIVNQPWSPAYQSRPLPADVPAEPGIELAPRRSVRIAGAILESIARTPLFRPVLYLVLAVAGLILRRRNPPDLPRLLLVSGLLYELALFVIAPTPDYRYSHWLILCTVFHWAMVGARWLAPSTTPA